VDGSSEWLMCAADLGPASLPVHDVLVPAFRIVRTEATDSQWEACQAVGSSPLGACVLAGNLLEWVEDDSHPSHAGAPADGSARVDEPRGDRRVLKGGSFVHRFADRLRATHRECRSVGEAAASHGVGCCATL